MDPVSEYRRTRILTASPGEIVVMLYDGVLQKVSLAKGHFETGQWGAAGEALGRAQDILYELMASLDRAKSPDLCDSLSRLYAYCSERLIEGLAQRNPKKLDEVDGLLRPLRVAWAEAVRKAKTETTTHGRVAVNG